MSEIENSEQLLKIDPKEAHWEKKGDEWVWETAHFRATASILGEDHNLCIHVQSSYNKKITTVTFLPKEVVKDLHAMLAEKEKTPRDQG